MLSFCVELLCFIVVVGVLHFLASIRKPYPTSVYGSSYKGVVLFLEHVKRDPNLESYPYSGSSTTASSWLECAC